MRSLWKGSITFGLLNVPIKAYKATDDHSLSFRTLHRKCLQPIQYRKYCSQCEQMVETEELVRGYEWQKGQFVVLEEQDLDSFEPESDHRVAIDAFIKEEEIDPVFFTKTYYLSPDQRGERAYRLLQEALRETRRVAVARIVLRSKESLACVRANEQGIALLLMFFPDEVRSWREVPDLPAEEKYQPTESEQKMAVELVNSLTSSFEPERYVNESRDKLLAHLEQKAMGQELTAPPVSKAAGAQVVDIMEALKASLAQAKSQKDQGEKKKASRKKGKVS